MMPKCLNKYIYPFHCHLKKSWTKKSWQTNTSETRGFPTFWCFRPPAKQSLVQSYWPFDIETTLFGLGWLRLRFDSRGPLKLQTFFVSTPIWGKDLTNLTTCAYCSKWVGEKPPTCREMNQSIKINYPNTC